MLFSFRTSLKDALMWEDVDSVICFVTRQNTDGTQNRGICNFQKSEIISLSLTSNRYGIKRRYLRRAKKSRQTYFHLTSSVVMRSSFRDAMFTGRWTNKHEVDSYSIQATAGILRVAFEGEFTFFTRHVQTLIFLTK